jgi:hypothetical protein
MMSDVLIVGRGPSVRGFDRWSDYGDVMAVSSGVFAIPEHARPPRHFVTMDVPRWYLHGFHDADTSIAWQNDWADAWPFWADERIEKHVPEGRHHRGDYRVLPEGLYDIIPPEAHAQFHRLYVENVDQFGLQPGWGDYSNVTPWPLKMMAPPCFNGTPEIGMQAEEGHTIRNSWFMTVQVAQRLGYRRFYFIGCDFLDEAHSVARGWLPKWCTLAKDAGLEWVTLSPDSALAEHIPAEVPA